MSNAILKIYEGFFAFLWNTITGAIGVRDSLSLTCEQLPQLLKLILEGENMDVTFRDIQEARSHLKDVVYKTGLVHNTTFSEMTGNFIYLKTENLQKTGSFKLRGAFNKIANLPNEQKKY